MKESNLLKISVITALIGILALLFILDKIDLSNAEVANLTKDDIDKKVEIKVNPQKAGEYPFSCGMNMFHGKVVAS